MVKKVIFYAPFGEGLPDYKLGGAEKGAQRIYNILENEKLEIIKIKKPYLDYGIVNFISLQLKAIFLITKLLITNRNILLYEVAFYGKNIYTEWLLGKIAKVTKNKFLYEPKNGSMISLYKSRTKIYRFFMKSTLKSADAIFAQGVEYIEFIDYLIKKEAIFVPNYVEDDKIINFSKSNKIFEPIRLIYVGRISESKNVDISIEILNDLISKGIDAHLDIIGGYHRDYKKILDNLIQEKKLDNRVFFHGRRDFKYIRKYLIDSHFFLFPSTEEDEGQSNSLTEAMTFGVVPVASSNGFSRGVINNQELIISDAKSYADYSLVIDKIIKTKRWKTLSDDVIRRIEENYSESIVKSSVKKAVDELFN